MLRVLAWSGEVSRRVLLAVAAAYAAAFICCATARLTFPFELAFLESGMLAMLNRLAAGWSMYVEPSSEYVPFIYPPLYLAAAHALAQALPPELSAGPTAMRLTSLCATLATAGAVAAVLARRRVAARDCFILAALVLAFYGRFRFWHDTSRVDSLFVLLTFSASALLIEGRSRVSAVAAGLAGGLAIVTKQQAAPLLGACGLLVAAAGQGRALQRLLVAGVTASLTVVTTLAALGELENPWFYHYVLRLPASHPLIPRHLIKGATFVLPAMPLFLVLAARELLPRSNAPDSDAQAQPGWTPSGTLDGARLWAATFIVFTAVMLALRLKEGASHNYFLPLVPVGVVVTASGLRRLDARAAPALLLAQFAILAYDPRTAVPGSSDLSAGDALVRAVRDLPGDVYLGSYPRYLALAGKPSVAHEVAVCDAAALDPALVHVIARELGGGPRRFGAVARPSAGVPSVCTRRMPGVDPFTRCTPAPRAGTPFSRFQDSRLAFLCSREL